MITWWNDKNFWANNTPPTATLTRFDGDRFQTRPTELSGLDERSAAEFTDMQPDPAAPARLLLVDRKGDLARYADPDALILPERMEIRLPMQAGVYPLVPLLTAFAQLESGDYAGAAQSSERAQAS